MHVLPVHALWQLQILLACARRHRDLRASNGTIPFLFRF
jgi:hypothetical protein